MKRLLIGLPLLAACTLPPEGISEEQLFFYDDALATLDCTLVDEGDFLATEFQTGLTREQINEVTLYKIEVEQVVPIETGGYRLITGPCETNAETTAPDPA